MVNRGYAGSECKSFYSEVVKLSAVCPRTREEVLACRTRRPTDMRVPSHLQIVRRRPRWAQSQLQSSAVAMPVTRRALGARFGCVPMGCCGAAVAQHRLQPCTVLPTHPPAVTASSLGVRPPAAVRVHPSGAMAVDPKSALVRLPAGCTRELPYRGRAGNVHQDGPRDGTELPQVPTAWAVSDCRDRPPRGHLPRCPQPPVS